MEEPLYGQRGEPELQELPMFFHTIMSIFSLRKKDGGVLSVVTSPTHHLWAAARASYSLSSLLLLRSGSRSRRFVSSIFRNVCRVGVFSQGCLSSHINAGAFADTESYIVKEERMSGMITPHCRRGVTRLSTQGVMQQSSGSNSDSIM